MNKYNSSLPSSNCSREDGVCSKRRARSISPQHKAKNPCKSSLDYSFGCNFCGLKFSGMESLQCHMPCEGSVTSKDPLKCGACGKTFRESLDMEKHLQGLHKNKLFKCEICCKNCASKSCLVWHMQIHVDIRSEKCENQSNTFLSRDAKTSHKSSECTICNKGFLSKLCLQSHMKQHKEIERESHSHVIVESSIILEKNSNSQGPMNRSFQDALDIRKLLTSDFVNKHAEYQVQNSRKHAERERSSWSIFDQVRLCDSASNSPFDHGQKTRNHEQSRSSVSIFDLDTSPKIATGQNESTGLICAQEINSKIKKTYRPYCVKCWATFEDLEALEEHVKFCNVSCQKSGPRELIPRVKECIITESEDQSQSSECVMENGSEEVAVKGIEDEAKNGSIDVAEDNSFEVLQSGSGMMATSKLHGGIAEEANDSLDEVAKNASHYWAKNSSDGLAEREPDDRASMIHVLAMNVAESFSGKCQVCGRLFLSQLLLDKHMRCHTGKKPYQCSQCDKCFSFREGLISHIHRHSAEKPYVCDICGKAFAVKAFLRSHLRIHTTYCEKCSLGSKINGASNQVQMKDKEKRLPKRFYGCGLCGSLYMAMISLKRHLPCAEGGASDKNSLFCGECTEKFCEGNELEKHVNSVHSENLLSCSICNKMFAKKSRLKRHMRSHTGERPYKCKQCSKGFKHAHHLKKHLPCYVIPGSDIKCNQCQETFYKISQLRTHISVDHSNKSVQCDVCGKKFVGPRALDIHLKTHVEDSKKPYSCMRCTKCFVRISSLKRHLETVHLDPLKCDVGNKNFHSKYQFAAYLKSQIFPITAGKDRTLYCLNCHNTFSSSEQLNKHLELHKLFGSSLSCNRCNHKFSLLDSLEEHTCQAYSILGPQFKCPECEEGFEISRQLKKHMSEVHSIEHPFKCKRCGKQYEKFCKWNNHVQAHRSDRHYVCNKCGKRFKYLHRLKSGHLPCLSDAAELKCPKCNQEFVKASLLRSHMTLCQNERAVQCQVCSRLFLNQLRLDKHMRCHTGEKPYQCSQCDKCFSFREGLFSHVHRHSAVKPYVCDVCGKTFAAETILQSHLRIHTTDRSHKCSDCDKSFFYACNLRYHKAKVHSGVKERFACSICNKTFCTKMYLNTHMLSHTGQNPYLCSFCGKGFPAKILLKYHVRVHTGEKPYTCQYCYMRFSMPRSMRNHERVHTGEKPYECTICGMKFSQSSYLKNHSRKVHKVE